MANLYIERGLVNRKLISLFNKYFSTKKELLVPMANLSIERGGNMAEQPTIKTTIQIDRNYGRK